MLLIGLGGAQVHALMGGQVDHTIGFYVSIRRCQYLILVSTNQETACHIVNLIGRNMPYISVNQSGDSKPYCDSHWSKYIVRKELMRKLSTDGASVDILKCYGNHLN